MIQLSAAGKRYGHKLLFEGADWMITPRDRVGLVGANGTGKSTVMKILAGLETLDYGSLSTAKGISAGYLPQDGLTLSFFFQAEDGIRDLTVTGVQTCALPI